MTGFRSQLKVDFRTRRGLMIATAGFCLALLAMLAVAQVAHLHAHQSDADHCQLCIVMHTAVPTVAAVAIIVIVQLESLALVPEPIVVTCKRQTRLFIRPPPVFC